MGSKFTVSLPKVFLPILHFNQAGSRVSDILPSFYLFVLSFCRKYASRHSLISYLCLRYMKYTLDQYVENDYTLIYFHYGLNSRNKPKFTWLVQAYMEFDRK